MAKTIEELREARKRWFAPMEQKLKEMHTKEDDSLFYYHSSEDRIVLSHAMFWTMTQLTTSGGGALITANDDEWREIMMYATQYRESYPYYQHEKIGYNVTVR